MSEIKSLSILSKATQMLAEVKTLDDAKHLKDIAAAAKVYAQKHHLGKEAVGHAREIEVKAEIMMGKFLLKMGKNKGGRKSTDATGASVKPATYKEIGISLKEGSEAQILAGLPKKEEEKVIKGKKSKKKAVKESKQKTKREKLEEFVTKNKTVNLSDICDLRVCSCQDLFQSGIKPDAVITDPPYVKEYLGVYSELAEACQNVPLVAVMCGQSYLPEVISRLCSHLKYRWTLAYLTPGGQSVQQWEAKVNTFWKPILLFGESEEWFGDVCKSKTNDNDKEHHLWGQSESGMADLVNRLTKPGQLICDPFLGGGTTGVVSIQLGRRFVGCDINENSVKKAKIRIIDARSKIAE